MRETVVRQVVTRLLTDPEFAVTMRSTPGKALREYDLADDELAALYDNDSFGSSLGRLETRISASVMKPIMMTPDCCGCVEPACASGKKDCKCCPASSAW